MTCNCGRRRRLTPASERPRTPPAWRGRDAAARNADAAARAAHLASPDPAATTTPEETPDASQD